MQKSRRGGRQQRQRRRPWRTRLAQAGQWPWRPGRPGGAPPAARSGVSHNTHGSKAARHETKAEMARWAAGSATGCASRERALQGNAAARNAIANTAMANTRPATRQSKKLGPAPAPLVRAAAAPPRGRRVACARSHVAGHTGGAAARHGGAYRRGGVRCAGRGVRNRQGTRASRGWAEVVARCPDIWTGRTIRQEVIAGETTRR